MEQSIRFDKVADIYDLYVNADFDIPFFINETRECHEEILELMCGTGRVSIPLLNSGRKLTCVDYSGEMLRVFKKKIQNKKYKVDLVEADITKLELGKKFCMVLAPFHSFAEIASLEMQTKALKVVSSHLCKNGIFILTLQNPKIRLKSADGISKKYGEFPMGGNKRMVVSYVNELKGPDQFISGYQTYELYNEANILEEKRVLEIRFRLTTDPELRSMLRGTGLAIVEKYGDYSYNTFDEESSNYMIYKMIKT